MPKFRILLKICLGLVISVVTFAIELPTIASFSAYNIYCIPEIPFERSVYLLVSLLSFGKSKFWTDFKSSLATKYGHIIFFGFELKSDSISLA